MYVVKKAVVIESKEQLQELLDDLLAFMEEEVYDFLDREILIKKHTYRPMSDEELENAIVSFFKGLLAFEDADMLIIFYGNKAYVFDFQEGKKFVDFLRKINKFKYIKEKTRLIEESALMELMYKTIGE